MDSKRRSSLATKGRRLYSKYCGTKGRGICTESFAIYHLSMGEWEVIEDLLDFLHQQVIRLEDDDTSNQLQITKGLIERITRHLTGTTAPDSVPLHPKLPSLQKLPTPLLQ